MTTVRQFPQLPTNMTAEQVKEQITGRGLKKVIVIGYDEAGDLHLLNSTMNNAEALWMVEASKRLIMG